METLTAEQFKNRYGQTAVSQFGNSKKEESLFAEIKSAFGQGVAKIGQGIEESNPTNLEGNLIKGTGQILGGASEAITAPLAPLLSRTIGKAVNWVGEQVGKIPAVQKFANSPAGEKASEIASTVSDYANIAGLVAGGATGARGARALPAKAGALIPDSIPNPLSGTGQYVRGAVRDVIPTTQSLIDQNLAKALDLTPGDLRNIAASTGNEVGPWMANYNLIGRNKIDTIGLINKFFTDNYTQVRSEIDKVPTLYKPTQVPYFTDALKSIAAETQGKVGLEVINTELQSLMRKTEVTLKDVQRVKELIDEHFKLYKATGDVQSGVAKQGLDKVRKDIKGFIETEVKKATGADIRQMNNNVATARSLADAVEARSPRGLTRAQITWRDAAIGMGLTYFGSPLVGLAAVAVWKIITSPTARLRFARWLDGLNDAQRARVSDQFRTGNITKEVRDIIGVQDTDLTNMNSPKTKAGEPQNAFSERRGVSAQRADMSGPFDGGVTREPITVYHGSKYGKPTSIRDGFSTATDESFAESYADGGKVFEYTLAPGTKVLDATNDDLLRSLLPKRSKAEYDALAKDAEGMRALGWSDERVKRFIENNEPTKKDLEFFEQNIKGGRALDSFDRLKQAVIAHAKANGYDAVKLRSTTLSGRGTGDEILILNPKKVSSPSLPKEL